MKKTIIAVSAAIILAAAAAISWTVFIGREDDFFKENVEALADGEGGGSIGDKVRDFIGCSGGSAKCFSGEINIKGVIVSGTWYIELN